MRISTMFLIVAVVLVSAAIGGNCMLNHDQRVNADLARLDSQSQVLPPNFLASITAIRESAGVSDFDSLFSNYDLQPLDENLDPIEGLTLNNVQAAIPPYALIPDRIYGSAGAVRDTGSTGFGEVANFATGIGHSHTAVQTSHSHDVWVDPSTAAFRAANVIEGTILTAPTAPYYALVSTVTVGQDVLYFITGFLQASQVQR